MIDKNDVIAWLTENPDLLVQHPELLDRLDLPHHSGTTSLIERQVERLREENQRLTTQLKTLAGIAGENERLIKRLHELTLSVMSADSGASFIEQLFARLGEDFRAEQVTLHLTRALPELDKVNGIKLHQDPPEWFQRLMDRKQIECGRLTREKLSMLFADQAGQIASAAVVPISTMGVLAIGASDSDRFYPGMGTLFLELLGTTIRHRLDRPEAIHRKRA